MLDYCDDDMLCKALGWLVLAKCMDLCERFDGSYWYAAYGHIMWAVMLMRRVWAGAKLLKRDGVIMCGLLEHR